MLEADEFFQRSPFTSEQRAALPCCFPCGDTGLGLSESGPFSYEPCPFCRPEIYAGWAADRIRQGLKSAPRNGLSPLAQAWSAANRPLPAHLRHL